MKALQLILISLAFTLIFSLENQSTSIKLNQKVTGFSNQKKIKFYNLNLEQNANNQDLLIDAKTVNTKTIYESPIVMISSVRKNFFK